MNNDELILARLEDLKERQDRHEETTGKVIDKLSTLEISLAQFKEHQKWELRIASGIWGIIMICLSWVFGVHNK